jgi:hypothetical protein
MKELAVGRGIACQHTLPARIIEYRVARVCIARLHCIPPAWIVECNLGRCGHGHTPDLAPGAADGLQGATALQPSIHMS